MLLNKLNGRCGGGVDGEINIDSDFDNEYGNNDCSLVNIKKGRFRKSSNRCLLKNVI